jgi:hypothetical protein
MLGHPTGMIGLPLRLLAREVYHIRSMARWVLPVLVGPSTAVAPRKRACGERERRVIGRG